MTFEPISTNTHQDHVIAHVIGTTVLGHFVWDETIFLLLDIGFVWNIYLDAEMGLLPHPVALSELDVAESFRSNLRSDVDALMRGDDELIQMQAARFGSPIVEVELLESDGDKRIQITCEDGQMVIQTSLRSREISLVSS